MTNPRLECPEPRRHSSWPSIPLATNAHRHAPGRSDRGIASNPRRATEARRRTKGRVVSYTLKVAVEAPGGLRLARERQIQDARTNQFHRHRPVSEHRIV